jgi:hypothetical protein
MPVLPKFTSKSTYILKGYDTHEQIMLAIREYFKANERWEQGISDRSGVDARNALGTLRILARERRKEIQAERKERKKKKLDPERKQE